MAVEAALHILLGKERHPLLGCLELDRLINSTASAALHFGHQGVHAVVNLIRLFNFKQLEEHLGCERAACSYPAIQHRILDKIVQTGNREVDVDI